MTPGEELLFLALGGSGEIGMNVNLYGCRGKWLMADLGLTFADPDYPGVELILPDPDEVESEIVAALPGTAAFAARFREAAARALLLPRRRPDQRTPLWQQRQRAADLLAVASKYPALTRAWAAYVLEAAK